MTTTARYALDPVLPVLVEVIPPSDGSPRIG